MEPDELLFKSLPNALRVPEVLASTNEYPLARSYATKLVDAVNELAGCSNQLRDQLFRDLLDASGETSREAITGFAKSLEDEVLDPQVRTFVLSLASDTLNSDADWIDTIATVLAGKAPSEWTDRDRAHFRHVLGRRVDAFQRLVALHTDQRADGGGPFKAFRVTITRPDGREHVALVGVDDRDQQLVKEVLDSAMDRLVPTVGSEKRGLSALIAVIAEQLLPSEDATDDDASIPLTPDNVRNA